jgi:hypothetical protein
MTRGADAERLTGSGGRHQIGTAAGFKADSVAGLRRNSQLFMPTQRARCTGQKTGQKLTITKAVLSGSI